jgi:hypothetical protein
MVVGVSVIQPVPPSITAEREITPDKSEFTTNADRIEYDVNEFQLRRLDDVMTAWQYT